MPVEIWSALIGVVGAIAGVWLGARLSRRAAVDLLSRQAKAEFASAFTGTLLRLYAEPDNTGEGKLIQILQEDFPSHFGAYLKLRAVLPKNEQLAIDGAWKKYSQDENYYNQEERDFYRFSHVLEPADSEHRQMLAIKHVNALVSCVAT